MRSAIPPPSPHPRFSPVAGAADRSSSFAATRHDPLRSWKAIVKAPLEIVDPRLTEPTTGSAHPPALAIAARIVARSLPAEPTPDAAASGAEEVFARLYRNLSHWVGSAGCQALFSRAFVLCAATHPVCAGVRYRPLGAAPHLERLVENARECGGEATAKGITEVVTSIVTMLTGLIGDEGITMSLLENGPPSSGDAAARPAGGNTPYKADGAGSSNGRDARTDRRRGNDRRFHD